MSAIDPGTELASGFTVSRYHKLRPLLGNEDLGAWAEIIAAVRRRIDERYLTPIEELARYDGMPRDERPTRAGFAIMALDCLLIDTIQSFKEGRSATAEKSSVHSFEEFLSAVSFSDFKKKERSNFFQNVRNALLHNGETRSDWKIRIDTDRMVTRDGASRIINRKLFHAAVMQEWKTFCDDLTNGVAPKREPFLRRLDAMAGLLPPWLYYFAYGSNMLGSECAHDTKNAHPRCRAFLPRYAVVFTKHSISRSGDAASLVRDDSSVTWGFVYRICRDDLDSLKKREIGYDLRQVLVFEDQAEFPKASPINAVTFVGSEQCAQKCGPRTSYLELMIAGAHERGLPETYTHVLSQLLGKARTSEAHTSSLSGHSETNISKA
jgi:cation transport regulator ChaC